MKLFKSVAGLVLLIHAVTGGRERRCFKSVIPTKWMSPEQKDPTKFFKRMIQIVTRHALQNSTNVTRETASRLAQMFEEISGGVVGNKTSSIARTFVNVTEGRHLHVEKVARNILRKRMTNAFAAVQCESRVASRQYSDMLSSLIDSDQHNSSMSVLLNQLTRDLHRALSVVALFQKLTETLRLMTTEMKRSPLSTGCERALKQLLQCPADACYSYCENIVRGCAFPRSDTQGKYWHYFEKKAKYLMRGVLTGVKDLNTPRRFEENLSASLMLFRTSTFAAFSEMKVAVPCETTTTLSSTRTSTTQSTTAETLTKSPELSRKQKLLGHVFRDGFTFEKRAHMLKRNVNFMRVNVGSILEALHTLSSGFSLFGCQKDNYPCWNGTDNVVSYKQKLLKVTEEDQRDNELVPLVNEAWLTEKLQQGAARLRKASKKLDVWCCNFERGHLDAVLRNEVKVCAPSTTTAPVSNVTDNWTTSVAARLSSPSTSLAASKTSLAASNASLAASKTSLAASKTSLTSSNQSFAPTRQLIFSATTSPVSTEKVQVTLVVNTTGADKKRRLKKLAVLQRSSSPTSIPAHLTLLSFVSLLI